MHCVSSPDGKQKSSEKEDFRAKNVFVKRIKHGETA